MSENELLIKKRDGKLWDSYIEMRRRIKNLPTRSFLKILMDFYNNERDAYYRNIIDL